jgi:hypothetical protein
VDRELQSFTQLLGVSTMSKHGIGVWIDQRNAFIVRPANEDCDIVEVLSDVEAHRKSTGGKAKSKPYMHESGPSSASHHDRSIDNAMNKYLSEVAMHLKGETNILLLGPGESKQKLRNLLMVGNDQYHKCEISLKASETMTKPQLKAAVLSHFGHVPERFLPQ